MNTCVLVGIILAIVCAMQYSVYAVGTYDIITMGSGAVMYFIFSSLKFVYLKKPFEPSDILLTATVMFIVGFGQKVIAGLVYPDADANKDGLVTRNEYEDWKRRNA